MQKSLLFLLAASVFLPKIHALNAPPADQVQLLSPPPLVGVGAALLQTQSNNSNQQGGVSDISDDDSDQEDSDSEDNADSGDDTDSELEDE